MHKSHPLRSLLQAVTRRTLMAFGLAMGLSACIGAAGAGGTGGDTWQEEVLLHDGQKIIVKRATVRGGRHEIGQRGAYTEQTLSFVQPGTGNTIEWVDRLSQDLGNSNFLPMLLDIKAGTPYLVVSPMGCMAYNKWGRPNPPYVIFQYQGKEWQRIALEALPSDIKTPNLIYSSPDDEAKKTGQAIVSAETIKALYAGYPRPEQKRILRESLANGGGCPVPSDAAAKPIAPEVDGKPLYYNWWPLAQEWLDKTYLKSK
jgi:hypothetical protein